MTPRELGEKLSSRELSEYIALLGVEPWGPYRSDFLAALQSFSSGILWNKDLTLETFIPKWGMTKEQIQAERDKELIKRLSALTITTEEFRRGDSGKSGNGAVCGLATGREGFGQVQQKGR